MERFRLLRILLLALAFLTPGLLRAADPSVTAAPVMLTPAESQKRMKLAPGYEINLYASELEFPIANPVAMRFDAKGRLWVANNPTYPHIKPDAAYQDSIVILEDTNQDGKADAHKIFAEGLYLPLAMALGDGGAYVSAEPNMIHLKDTNGDDKADETRVILHGFGSEDSHHALHSYQWAPDGSFYFAEGTFLVSNVETPWGPKRTHDSAAYRFKPSLHKLDVFSNYGFSNPWGVTFDRWGHPVILDASDGMNYYLPHLMQNFALDQLGPTLDYPGKHKLEDLVFYRKGRPNSGAEWVSSHQFPPEVQGTYLNGQCIGFHGIRWIWPKEEGSGFVTTRTEDLLTSYDTTCRPVDLMFGPDGALYVLDYYNPIVGHMQYPFRDARRASTHGRIWRITAKDRPLSKQPAIAGEPALALLNLLKDPIDRTRYHARRELQERNWTEVRPALQQWLSSLDPQDPNYDLHRLEAFWIFQGHDELNLPLLEQLFEAKEGNVRASATMALRFELYRVPDPWPYLTKLISDPHMRVRLEAVNALSCLDSPRATQLIVAASNLPMDAGLYHAMRRALEYLERYGAYTMGESVFSLRKKSTPELTAALDAQWTDLAARELLVRPDLDRKRADQILEKFQQTTQRGRVETLFEITEKQLNSGATKSVAGLAGRFASCTPEEAAQAENAVLDWMDAGIFLRAPVEIRQAAYAVLLISGKVPASHRLEMASRRNEIAILAAGAAQIRDVALLERIWPDLQAFVTAKAAELPVEAVRDALSTGTRIPAKRAEIFAALTRDTEKGPDALRRGAIAAMRTVPLKDWPKGFEAFAGPLKIAPEKLALGKEIYSRENYCGQCHQPNGLGVNGAFPPLVATPWVEGSPERLIKVSQLGLAGHLEVNGVPYFSAMPPMGVLMTDDELAAVLTYVRTSWDNLGDEITAAQVKAVREKLDGRMQGYTPEEILKEHPLEGSK